MDSEAANDPQFLSSQEVEKHPRKENYFVRCGLSQRESTVGAHNLPELCKNMIIEKFPADVKERFKSLVRRANFETYDYSDLFTDLGVENAHVCQCTPIAEKMQGYRWQCAECGLATFDLPAHCSATLLTEIDRVAVTEAVSEAIAENPNNSRFILDVFHKAFTSVWGGPHQTTKKCGSTNFTAR